MDYAEILPSVCVFVIRYVRKNGVTVFKRKRIPIIIRKNKVYFYYSTFRIDGYGYICSFAVSAPNVVAVYDKSPSAFLEKRKGF